MSSSRRSRNQLGVFQSLAAQAPVHTWEDKKRTEVKNSRMCVLNSRGSASTHLSAAKNCKWLMKAAGRKEIQLSKKSHKVIKIYQLNAIHLMILRLL